MEATAKKREVAIDVSKEKKPLKPHFPVAYDSDSASTRERRKKLFAELARNRTDEGDAAMNALAHRFIGRFNAR